MHRDPAAVLMETLAETFGERHETWPDGVLLSAPYFGIVLQCLWDEDLDHDEAVDFLHRAEAALLDDTPALFPPTAYSDRLAGNLPAWWSTRCDRSPRRLSAWIALTAAHQLLGGDGELFRSCTAAALSACELLEEACVRANTKAFVERMAQLSTSRG
ncbi:hypothetical protein PZ61_0237645 [Streptomyces sp. MNU77]|uniref:hypothetical protein n=1 Tax=Streptomyces sp. MNU77 TaxID=1573406 RepID=UPI0005DC2305|nr:hypothetical protein [Streptomyces sp. MNU77]OLO25423.1 hypothetical protein PZ61_0237645 [Streptomyces sp. MNU77]